ncbi:hypothetical protein [Nocardia sp. XZ_19_385]|uniref:hypothetical protein n=1 Tax=Nocardia sp. XZ_19_385 TaxID=2769488 RepID=UPI001890A35A|nr:hypothetical protein [Nocardia sp. XZ_19_385]
MTVDDVARDLYGLDPAEFVAARTEQVKAAKDAGDKALATAIGKLRKPTVTAWTVNLLARSAPKDVDALLQLGAALRSAQRELSGEQLRALTTQRQQVVNALAKQAAALAAEHGHPASESVLREVGQTLTAALADDEVAERVHTGTLATAATYDGFGPESPALVSVGGTEHKGAKKKAPEPDTETAQQELDDALEALESAQAARDSAQEDTDQAAQRLADTEARIAQLRADLEHAEQEKQFAKSTERTAQEQLRSAQRQLDRVERWVERARERVD